MITQLDKHYSAVFKKATESLYISYYRGYTSNIVIRGLYNVGLGIHSSRGVEYNISCHTLEKALHAYKVYFMSLAPIRIIPIRWLYGVYPEGLKQEYTIYSPMNMYVVEVPKSFGESLAVSPDSTLKASAYTVTAGRVPLYQGEFSEVYHKVQQAVLQDYLDMYRRNHDYTV